jgi:hypothetical protein
MVITSKVRAYMKLCNFGSGLEIQSLRPAHFPPVLQEGKCGCRDGGGSAWRDPEAESA